MNAVSVEATTSRIIGGTAPMAYAHSVVSLLTFGLAAVLEIGGCFAFWMWLRRGATPLVSVLGIVSLVGFATVLTRIDSPFAGRAYAAYGGVYIVASLGWLWAVEGQRPTGTDLAGALLALAGAVIIIGAATRSAAR
jgi:small multidrug resistance family-3 protein